MILILILLTIIVSTANVVKAQTIIPPVMPLAVRSPYLSCWQNHSNGAQFGDSWPTTINISQILGWSVLVRVDGMTYSFLGAVQQPTINATVNITNFTITPTRTIVTGKAGPMQVNLTFLNPIEPQDWVKQSTPFSYLAFAASSLDGASHAVQVYSDVSAEWNSGDRNQTILWGGPPTNSDVVFHNVQLQVQVPFMEILDQAEWGFLYYATLAGANITTKSAKGDDARNYFARNATLDNQVDPNIRNISDQYVVFGIARDLGSIQVTQAPVVWAVGYTTDPVISYADLSGASPTNRRPYYTTQYDSKDENLIIDFLKDYSNALLRAQQLDNNIIQNATSVSSNLGGLVSVAIAQVFGSMQLTVGADAHGNVNDSDVMIFMKNIGGFGPSRVTAVETLYAAFPALMYINASFGKPLLEPLLSSQASHNYTIRYAAADLGSNYPNVSISNSNHSQGVEQTGNMLIMTYAYARASGDGSLISKYYDLLAYWAEFLNTSALFNSNQHSADNLSVNNQTNLAIKGIIAIEAMSKMSSVVNRTDDANKYASAASSLYIQWKRVALASDQHLLAAYGQSDDSWTLGYNLFADVWLDTNLVEPSIYDGHSSFIDGLVLTSNFGRFGMPSDNVVPTDTSSAVPDTSLAVSSWSLFAAAAMTTNQALSSELITRVSKRASSTNTSGIFPVYYDSADGTTAQGMASPAQGAVFAPLFRSIPSKQIIVNPTPANSPLHKTNSKKVGAIVGGVIAGAVFVAIGVVISVRRRRRWGQGRPKSVLSSSTEVWENDPHAIITPFDPNSYSSDLITQDSRNLTRTEQQPLISTDDPEGEMGALHHLSSGSSPPAAAHLRPRLAAPVPVGLSGKELARIRAEALASGSTEDPEGEMVALNHLSSDYSSPVPVGLSSKELARLRAEALTSGPQRQSNESGPSAPNMSRSTSSPANVVSESGREDPPIDTRRLHSEVESLRREMERLRAEGVIIVEGAPPSYTDGDR